MHIHQLHTQYLPGEDRLVLYIKMHDESEIKFLLTRRYVQLLKLALTNIMQSAPEIAALTQKDSRRTAVAYQHNKNLDDADFSQPYSETEGDKPLGDEAILLAHVKVLPPDKNTKLHYLKLSANNGVGIELPMPPKLLSSLYRLIKDGSRKAKWDINFDETEFHHDQDHRPSQLN